jgi:hypothetical protein
VHATARNWRTANELLSMCAAAPRSAERAKKSL